MKEWLSVLVGAGMVYATTGCGVDLVPIDRGTFEVRRAEAEELPVGLSVPLGLKAIAKRSCLGSCDPYPVSFQLLDARCADNACDVDFATERPLWDVNLSIRGKRPGPAALEVRVRDWAGGE